MRYLIGLLSAVALVGLFPLQSMPTLIAQPVQNWDTYQYKVGSEGQIIDNNEEGEQDQEEEDRQQEFGVFPPEKLDPDKPLQEEPLQEDPIPDNSTPDQPLQEAPLQEGQVS